MSQLDVTIAQLGAPTPFITVQGNASLSGALVIEIGGQDLPSDKSATLINATSISGTFDRATVRRNGQDSCIKAKLEQTETTLTALLYVLARKRADKHSRTHT